MGSSRAKKKGQPTTESQQLAMLKWLENEQNFAMIIGATTSLPMPSGGASSTAAEATATTTPVFVAMNHRTKRVTKAECYRQLRTHVNAQTSANWSVDTTRTRYESYVHMYKKARKLLEKMRSKLNQKDSPQARHMTKQDAAQINELCPFYDRMDALYGHTMPAVTAAPPTHPVVPVIMAPTLPPATIVPIATAGSITHHHRLASESSCSSVDSSALSQDESVQLEEGDEGEARSTGVSSTEDDDDEEDEQAVHATNLEKLDAATSTSARLVKTKSDSITNEPHAEPKPSKKRSITADVTIGGEEEEPLGSGKQDGELVDACVETDGTIRTSKTTSKKARHGEALDDFYVQQQAKQLELYQEELKLRREELQLKKDELEQNEQLRVREIKSQLLQALVAAGKSMQEAQEFLTLV